MGETDDSGKPVVPPETKTSEPVAGDTGPDVSDAGGAGPDTNESAVEPPVVPVVEPPVVEPPVPPVVEPPVQPAVAPAEPPPAKTGTAAIGTSDSPDDAPSLKTLTKTTATEMGIAPAASDARSRPLTDAQGTIQKLKPITIEETRQDIAYRLIWLLAAVIGFYLLVSLSFSQACWDSPSCSVKDAFAMSAASFTTVFTALLGIVGSVVGFYFGSQNK